MNGAKSSLMRLIVDGRGDSAFGKDDGDVEAVVESERDDADEGAGFATLYFA